MAIQRYTIRKILDDLNGQGADTPWKEIEGVYILSKTNVVAPDQLTPTGHGAVLKCFINEKTLEIKTYLAKFLDTPESVNLP